jgi:hypothetical protein
MPRRVNQAAGLAVRRRKPRWARRTPASYLIVVTAAVGQAILIEASLSYLGLGVQEPLPAWGLMLQGGAQEYAESAPWVAIFPGIAIFAGGVRLQPVRRRAARLTRPQIEDLIAGVRRRRTAARSG